MQSDSFHAIHTKTEDSCVRRLSIVAGMCVFLQGQGQGCTALDSCTRFPCLAVDAPTTMLHTRAQACQIEDRKEHVLLFMSALGQNTPSVQIDATHAVNKHGSSQAIRNVKQACVS